MPKDTSIKKVMVIGSGPIIIGQAAEFDYAGTQACRILKEEGMEVVLVNSNPATIMTDVDMADHVYLEPLTARSIERIIEIERPDSLLPTLGGQTGLNLAMELAESGVLERLGVRLLGTSAESIAMSEDREAFKRTMESIGQPCIESVIAEDVEASLAFAAKVGYPLIIRPAYTLGGTGGGIAYDEEQLIRISRDGLRASRTTQILVEKSVEGWKEIEYEVMRDSKGNCIVVCNMENFDPVGVHTGDSIVVAPCQTLRDAEAQMLRTASLNIINALKIQGGCNVQYALDPNSMQYYVIEVNPRVSRSSALASKATGYPIAKVATRIAIGYGLDEILNGVTGKTYAAFEPTLDYIVCKFPSWPFDKFVQIDRRINTQMKATGEAMSISTHFETALMKAVRSLEIGMTSLEHPRVKQLSTDELKNKLHPPHSERLFVLAEALRRGVSQEEIFQKTRIDPWFIAKVGKIVAMEEMVKTMSFDDWTQEKLLHVKHSGISDAAIAAWQGVTQTSLRALRKKLGITLAVRTVDTCGAEFEAVSPYYYTCYGVENEFAKEKGKTVVVLGSGPIRIGQGIEFDYCSVQCVWALKRAGYQTVIVNNNPETVSTDFDTADRLYFDPLTPEEVLGILDMEKPDGVIVQFGGQTAIKLARAVHEAGYPILGTPLSGIDAAEDRKQFDALLNELSIARPMGDTVWTTDEAIKAAESLGYPVLVRPSYVLGGQGMQIAYNSEDVRAFMERISLVKQDHPILVDQYLPGKEIEVDAICDGTDILIPGIMEHIERAGVHSGDSLSLYPARRLDFDMTKRIIEVTKNLALGLGVKGLINIQFIMYKGDLYVIEANPRSSRTIPFIAKATGMPVVDLAVRAALGQTVRDMGYGTGLYRSSKVFSAKMPVFSFEKLPGAEISLGPEMKSTGEVMGISDSASHAILKCFQATGLNVPEGSGVLLSVADQHKNELIPLAHELVKHQYVLYATKGTAQFLQNIGIDCKAMPYLEEGDDIRQAMLSKQIRMLVNTPTQGRFPKRSGFQLRQLSLACSVPCFTSLDTVAAFLQSIEFHSTQSDLMPYTLQWVHSINKE